MAADPLSQVYTALWDMAEGREELKKLVRLKNRIRYDTADRDPEKRSLTDADVPELALICSGMTGNICNTSSTSEARTRYGWVISTGDMRVTHRMLPVNWELWCAMHDWQTVLGNLQWNGKSYVKHMNMLDVQEGVLRPNERQDVPRGWACIWTIEIGMYFDLADLRA